MISNMCKAPRGYGWWLAVILSATLMVITGSAQSVARDPQLTQRLGGECGGGAREACRKLVSSELLSEAFVVAQTGSPSLVHGLAAAASDHGDAILFLRIGVRRFPADVSFLYELGARILDSGTVLAPTDAEAYGPLTQAVEAKPDFFDALVLLGQLELRREHPIAAEARFRAAVRSHPDRAVARNGLGTALVQMGHVREGADEFLAASRLAGDDAEQRWRAQMGLGEALFWRGDGEGALRVQRIAEKDETSGSGAIKCAEAVTLRWLGRDDEAGQACLEAVEGPMYCSCQGRRDDAGGVFAPFTHDDSASVVAAIRQSAVVGSGDAEVIVDATTAFSDVEISPVVSVRGRFLALTHQYNDAPRVREAVENLLVRSRRTAPVDLSGVVATGVHTLSRREMQEMTRGAGPSFYERFPKARGFVTVSRPGFSSDQHVAAVAVQINRDIWNGPVELFVLDRIGDTWVLRRGAETRR
jgi:hypothetical protein